MRISNAHNTNIEKFSLFLLYLFILRPTFNSICQFILYSIVIYGVYFLVWFLYVNRRVEKSCFSSLWGDSEINYSTRFRREISFRWCFTDVEVEGLASLSALEINLCISIVLSVMVQACCSTLGNISVTVIGRLLYEFFGSTQQIYYFHWITLSRWHQFWRKNMKLWALIFMSRLLVFDGWRVGFIGFFLI